MKAPEGVIPHRSGASQLEIVLLAFGVNRVLLADGGCTCEAGKIIVAASGSVAVSHAIMYNVQH